MKDGACKVRIMGSPFGYELVRRVREVTNGTVFLHAALDPEHSLRFDRATGKELDAAFSFEARIHPDDVRALRGRAPETIPDLAAPPHAHDPIVDPTPPTEHVPVDGEDRRVYVRDAHFDVDDRIFHAKFGHGVAIAATATTVDVRFDRCGTKRLCHRGTA